MSAALMPDASHMALTEEPHDVEVSAPILWVEVCAVWLACRIP